MDPLNFHRSGLNDTGKNDLITTVSIRSRDGIFPTDDASNFTVSLTNPILFRTVQLLDASVTINNYNLRSSITLEETGFPPITITLPPAIYNDSNIAAALQTALNAATLAGNVYTVTIDTTNYTVRVVAVGVTWRFINVDSSNDTYYALGISPTRIPPLATPALAFTFGAYDLRPYDIIYIDIEDMLNGNLSTGYRTATFTLTCTNVNSGGIATFQTNSDSNQFWVNTMGRVYGKLTITLRDSYGTRLPLRGGSTNLLLSFNRITGGPHF